MLVVSGLVRIKSENETLTGLNGVRIALHPQQGISVITRTKRDGGFQVSLTETTAEKLFDHQPFTVQILNQDGKVVGESETLVPDPEGKIQVMLTVDDPTLGREPSLPNLPAGGLSVEGIRQVITAAIDVAASQESRAAFQEIAAQLFCGFPPITVSPDLFDIIRGVLEGRVEDLRRMQDTLFLFDGSNHQHPNFIERPLSLTYAQELLSGNAFPIPENPHNSFTERLPISRQESIPIIVAAMIAAEGDPIQIHRNVGVIDFQFCLLGQFNRLALLANAALTGGLQQHAAFLNHLGVLGGCGPGSIGPPLPGSVPSIPCGRPPWPPIPDEKDIGIGRTEMWACLAELAPRFVDLLEGMNRYRILNVEPRRACPGERIVIRGENFSPDGATGVVRFTSRNPDGSTSMIEVTPTENEWSDTEISVNVPFGAQCGPLELDIPEAREFFIACGIEIDLYFGPRESFVFEGGETLITRFEPIIPSAGCYGSGGPLTVVWGACNADEITFRITHPDGSVVSQDFSGPNDGRWRRETVRLPETERDLRLMISLQVSGPCGFDVRQADISVRHDRMLSAGERFPFTPTPTEFVNWHCNIQRRPSVAAPTSLDELVRAVLTAENDGQRLGLKGSGWSFTDCVVPVGSPFTGSPSTRYMLQTVSMAGTITDVLETALLPEASIESVINADTLTLFPIELSSIHNRLVHVEGGIKLHALNTLLDENGLAMPTLGGSNGQSLAGALSTSTHGTNPTMPPIVDFVRAIHLVGPGGQEWWLEPRSRPITDEQKMEALKQQDAEGRSVLNPCLRVIYNDNLFHAVQVAFGQAGVIYAYVVETIDKHDLRSVTRGMLWEAAREEIQSRILAPDIPETWFLEVTVNPIFPYHARVTTKTPVRPGSDSIDITTPFADAPQAILDCIFGVGAVFITASGIVALAPALVGGPITASAFTIFRGAVGAAASIIADFIRRKNEELFFLHLGLPFTGPDIVDNIREQIEAAQTLSRTLERIISALGDGDIIVKELGEIIAELLNLLWRIGIFDVSGRAVVDCVQNIFTNYSERPSGTTVKPSFISMTGEPASEDYDLFNLIESHEYVLDGEAGLIFADRLLEIANDLRGNRETDSNALVVIINVRYTRETKALMGIQQFTRSCHIEVFTIAGLDGNEEFHRRLRQLADDTRAIPHWGQFHDRNRSLGDLFDSRPGSKFDRWKAALDRIANEGGGALNTFRNAFAIDRNLLSDL